MFAVYSKTQIQGDVQFLGVHSATQRDGAKCGAHRFAPATRSQTLGGDKAGRGRQNNEHAGVEVRRSEKDRARLVSPCPRSHQK